MTTPSETRAGKLPERWRQLADKRSSRPGDMGPIRLQQCANELAEALAASEPVDAVGSADIVRNLRQLFAQLAEAGWGHLALSTVEQAIVAISATHPAPEQPGRGELAIAIKALRKIATEQSAVTPTEAADLFQRLARDALNDIGTSRIFTGAPQPSDPAEGDALTFNAFRAANVARCLKWHPAGIASWSPADWLTAVTGELGELASLLKMRNRERDRLPGNKFSPTDKQVADELADVLTYLDLLAEVLGVNLGRAAVEKFNEVSERVGFPDRIALSTPPTAAVRVDMDDLLFVGFDKNSEHRLFRMRETAERHCIGEIKTYAALDPQVKR